MRVRRSGAAALALTLTLAMSACGGDDAETDLDAGGGTDTGTEATDGATDEATDGGEGAGEAQEFEPGTPMAEFAEAGQITVGTKFDQPLFGQANLEGEPEGFDVEIAKLIAQRLGIEEDGIEWVEAVSANREPFLQQGRVDMVVATYTMNEERDEVIDFAGPYYIAGQDILVPEGNPEGIEGPEDLAGLQVCSVTGSTPAQNIRENYPDAQLVEFDTYTACRDALQNGQVDAVTTDNVILAGYVAQAPDEFDLVNNPFTEEPYGIGVQQTEEKVFCEWINETLEEIYESGEWAEAFEQTVGQAVEETPEPPSTGSCDTPGAP